MKRDKVEKILNKYYLGNSLDGAVDEILVLFSISKSVTCENCYGVGYTVDNSVKIALLKQLEALSDYLPAEIYTRKVIEIKEQFL